VGVWVLISSRTALCPLHADGDRPNLVQSGTSVRLQRVRFDHRHHDRYDGKYLKTMTSSEQHGVQRPAAKSRSLSVQHIEIPGKLRIAFLPASQKEVGSTQRSVASFEQRIRVDFRPSVNHCSC